MTPVTPVLYARLRDTAAYWAAVEARVPDSDGCTGVPDSGATLACKEHDLLYQTHHTVDGVEVDRPWADALFRARLERKFKFSEERAERWFRAVRLFGWLFWMRRTPVRWDWLVDNQEAP